MSSRKIVVHDLVRDFRNKLRKEIFEIATEPTPGSPPLPKPLLYIFFLAKWSQVARRSGTETTALTTASKIMAKLRQLLWLRFCRMSLKCNNAPLFATQRRKWYGSAQQTHQLYEAAAKQPVMQLRCIRGEWRRTTTITSHRRRLHHHRRGMTAAAAAATAKAIATTLHISVIVIIILIICWRRRAS